MVMVGERRGDTVRLSKWAREREMQMAVEWATGKEKEGNLEQ